MTDIQKKAIKESEIAHSNESRETGEAFFCHPKRVFTFLKDNSSSNISLICGLLHDTVEHNKLALPYIHKHYGIEVSYIVDALTRRRNEKAKDSWLRLSSMAQIDPRIIEIKLADRIDNIKTLWCFSTEKQKEYINETEWMIKHVFSKYKEQYPTLINILSNEVTNIKN